MPKPIFIHGFHSVDAEIQNRPEMVVRLFVRRETKNPRLEKLRILAQKHKIKIDEASGKTLQKLVGDEVHQNVVAEICPPMIFEERALLKHLQNLAHPPLVLILDGVEDPRNFGACLRSAGAFSADAVVVGKHQSAPLNASAYKAASGALGVVPVFRVNHLAQTMAALKKQNIWLVGLDQNAPTAISKIDLNGALALVLGGEGKGLRRLTRAHLDYEAKIPIAPGSGSLNVSVAAAVGLFAASEQRGKAAKYQNAR